VAGKLALSQNFRKISFLWKNVCPSMQHLGLKTPILEKLSGKTRKFPSVCRKNATSCRPNDLTHDAAGGGGRRPHIMSALG